MGVLLLYFSAAFDLVDHGRLLFHDGFDNTSLQSYLVNRKQCTFINGAYSEPHTMVSHKETA